jgi:hypothetical protein
MARMSLISFVMLIERIKPRVSFFFTGENINLVDNETNRGHLPTMLL